MRRKEAAGARLGIKAVLQDDGTIELIEGGKTASPDYRMAAGDERILIREYSKLKEKSMWTFSESLGAMPDSRFSYKLIAAKKAEKMAKIWLIVTVAVAVVSLIISVVVASAIGESAYYYYY